MLYFADTYTQLFYYQKEKNYVHIKKIQLLFIFIHFLHIIKMQ